MSVYTVDPLVDDRWPILLDNSPCASVFHGRGWLEALRRTYRYEPVVYTTCAPGEPLTNGIVCCRVNSWLTGRRLVSVPFSDHCEPLVDGPDELRELLLGLAAEVKREGLKYVELRPLTDVMRDRAEEAGFAKSQGFYFHSIDITPEPDVLFQQFHRTCVRVKIGRAERENLLYEEGRSEKLVSQFYKLLMLTRRKHHVPPPPKVWFENLAQCLNEDISIRLAYKDELPIASIITLRHGDKSYYKYTGHDMRFVASGGTHALLWMAIKDAKERGARLLDFGRTDVDNNTLVEYKERWASVRSEITYLRFPAPAATRSANSLPVRMAKQTIARLPSSLLVVIGRFLYRHVG